MLFLTLSIPRSACRWFPFSASTDEHEFHHSKNLGCFGKFGLLSDFRNESQSQSMNSIILDAPK